MLKQKIFFKVIITIIITIFFSAWINLEESENISPPVQEIDQAQVMVFKNYPTNDNSTDNDEIESIDGEKDVFYYLFGPLCPLWIFILVVVGIVSYAYHRKYIYQKDIKYLPPGSPLNQPGVPLYPQNAQYPQYTPPQPHQPDQQSQNLCSNCQQPLIFYSQYQKWYCNYCRRYV